MNRYQYLLVLAACLVITLPLELILGTRVWRQPRRLVQALLPPALLFSAWDIAAIAHHQWSFARRYVTGWNLPGHLPVEEVAFFLVVPICALLTFEAVSRLTERRGAAGRGSAGAGSAGRRRR
jgi:lycopene beta-cyclase